MPDREEPASGEGSLPSGRAEGDVGAHDDGGREPPTELPPEPPTEPARAPSVPRSILTHVEPPPVPRPGILERAAIFVAGILLDAVRQTFDWLGLTRLRRLPFAILVFGALFFVLGLPPDGLHRPFAGRTLELGDWGPHTAWRALLVQVAATFAVRLVLARPRLKAARRIAPAQTRRYLIDRADELLAAPVTSDEELQAWIREHGSWLQVALRDLTETHGREAADQVRSASADGEVRFRHAYNPVHDGWLNLLARRIEVLRGLRDDPKDEARLAR